jgi:catechol 2,3-dioxygenase-like lactoylglutathione lyase family enzyme
MKATLEKAFGYQGDNMNLPVENVEAALPFYETVLGFRIVSHSDTPHKSAVLSRDEVQIALAENGGDSSQDGCAFHVKNLEALFASSRPTIPNNAMVWSGKYSSLLRPMAFAIGLVKNSRVKA